MPNTSRPPSWPAAPARAADRPHRRQGVQLRGGGWYRGGMSDDSRYVSADVAAKRLKVSPATVRRRIRAGTLEGMVDRRPQGEVYLVLADALPPDNTDAEEIREKAETPAETPSLAPDTTAVVPDTSLAYLDAIMTLAEKLEEAHAEIADLRERAGRAEAELAAETARLNDAERELADVKHELMEARRRAERPWWKFWGGPA